MNFISFIIDYIWYVGEKIHLQEQNPGDGNMMIAITWYCTLFFPLLYITNRLHIYPIIQIIFSIILILFPFIFCRLRYTQEYKKVIFAEYKNTKIGHRLFMIWGGLIIIVAIETFLFIKLGWWNVIK